MSLELEVLTATGELVARKPLGSWGIETLELTVNSLNADAALWTQAVADAANDPEFARGQRVRLWAGARKVFEGEVDRVDVDCSAGAAHIHRVTALGPWALFKRIPYLQEWRTAPGGSVFTSYSTHAMLFAGPMLEPVSAGAQIADACGFVASLDPSRFALAPQPAPEDLFLPAHPVRDAMVEEVIRIALERATDVVSWFDYATEPPTLYFRRIRDLPVRAYHLDDPTVQAVGLKPLTELQAAAVQYNFERVDTFNGVAQQLPLSRALGTVQVWPEEAWDEAAGRLKPWAMLGGAVVQTIALEGTQQQTVSMDIESAPHNILSKSWWAERLPGLDLSDPENPLAAWDFVGTPGLTDCETREPIDPSEFPLDLLRGSVEPWMNAQGHFSRRAKAWCKVAWTHKNGSQGEDLKSFEMEVTNCPSGHYETLASLVAGENIPAELARVVQESLSELRWSGTIVVEGEDCDFDVHPGVVINVSGGQPAWAGMRAQVASVRHRIGEGRTEVTLGMPRHLGGADILDLIRISRQRRVFVNPAARGNGSLARPAGRMELAMRTPNNWESTSAPRHKRMVLENGAVRVELNGAGGGMRVFESDTLRVDVSAGGLPAGAVAMFRPHQVCVKVSEEGVEPEVWEHRTVWVLCTAPL